MNVLWHYLFSLFPRPTRPYQCVASRLVSACGFAEILIALKGFICLPASQGHNAAVVSECYSEFVSECVKFIVFPSKGACFDSAKQGWPIISLSHRPQLVAAESDSWGMIKVAVWCLTPAIT